jgi:hypothetical protein
MYQMSNSLEAIIPAIAPKLTRLKALRVVRVTLAYQGPKFLSALIHNFSALQELYIDSVTFKRFRDLAALIIAHPFLECLDIEDIWWNESVTAASHWENVFHEYPDLCSRLRRITLNHTSVAVIDWISSYYRVLPVHTVTLTTIYTCDIPHVARLLQTIGSSLEHLIIYIHQDISESPGMNFPFVEAFISH